MTTYYVSTSGTDDPGGGTTTGTAWRTLQYAANNVSAGDTVKVLPGEYDRFDIRTGGNSSSGVITFEANDLNDRPYIRTEYYNIADSALGSTNRTDAGIRVTADYVTLNGFRFTNERAIAIALQWGGANTSNVTVSNCYFYRCRAILKLTAKKGETMVIGGKTVVIDKKGTGPIWISHSGKGFTNRNIHFHDLEFVECSARVPVTGGGTEICTFFGAHDGILVEDCSWTDCYGINLNFLGVDTSDEGSDTIGQPKNIVVRNNTFNGAYRTNDGAQASVNSLYFDRGTGPAEVYGNVFYNPGTMASVTSSFEKEWRISQLVPNRRIVFRDNVIVSGDFALRLGTNSVADINENRAYKSEDIGVAHNVLIVANSQWNLGPLQMSSVRNVSVRNNVIANYKGGILVFSRGVQSNADIASWSAAGNIVWTTKAGSSVEWGLNRNMTAGTFNANIQGGTGWTSKPVFANGVNAINANTDLSSYTLADWTLAAASPGYKDALPVTYANGAGTAATDITVDDAKFFAPGIPGLGVSGTTILIGGTEAVVTGVNHSTNMLSLDREVTWSDNAEIRYKPTTAGVYSVGITSAASVDSGQEFGDDDPENLLSNGYFTEGDTAWYFSEGDGVGRFVVSGEAASLPITTGGSTIQLYQFDLPITSGEDYVLTVYGSSDRAPQTVTAKVILHASPYTNLGLNSTFDLTAGCQANTLSFTATGTSTNARLQLIFTDAGLATIRGVYLGLAGGAVDQCPENDGGGSLVPVTQNLKVAASLDDWGDNSGTFFGTTDAILAGGGDKDASRYDYRYLARFAISDTITTGDTVTAASLRLYRSGSDSGATIPAARIYAVDSTNSTRPADATASKAQSLTTAYVDWTMGSATSEWKTINGLQSIIQELVDSGTLTAGNYVTIVVAAQVSGWGGSNTMQYFRTYDYSDGSLAAELSITSVTPVSDTGEHAFGETFSETFAETFGGW